MNKTCEKTVLWDNRYCAEELADIDRDISECLDARFNPMIHRLPKNGLNSMLEGTVRDTVTWEGVYE